MPSLPRIQKPELIAARIGKKARVRENEPPERGLEDIERDQWRAAILVIDPKHHHNGQRVLFENTSWIGQAFGNFQSLVDHINFQAPNAPYYIQVNEIASAAGFWDFARLHTGQITSVTLEVAMPNMFGGTTSYEEDMKRLRDREKATKVRETISNPDGLNVETDRMKEAVDYAAKGGGRVTAKTKTTASYDSRSKVEITQVTIDDEEATVEQRLSSAIDAFDFNE